MNDNASCPMVESIMSSVTGSGKIIFWTNFIEVPKVHANAELSIFLSHRNNVCDPRWVLDLANESRLYEFVDLLFDFWH